MRGPRRVRGEAAAGTCRSAHGPRGGGSAHPWPTRAITASGCKQRLIPARVPGCAGMQVIIIELDADADELSN